MHFRRYAVGLLLLFSLTLSGAVAAHAQGCTAPVYCEGWDRDSCHVEVPVFGPCANPLAINALPSVRIGSYDHVVLGFSNQQPLTTWCFNIGVSFRYLSTNMTKSASGAIICDPIDPEPRAAGATFGATYPNRPAENVVISNIVYDSCFPEGAGLPPVSLDLDATGTNLGIHSHFTFQWSGDEVVGWTPAGYTEARTYTKLAGPNNTVHITVTNINYSTKTFTVSAPDAGTPSGRLSWGVLKVRYR